MPRQQTRVTTFAPANLQSPELGRTTRERTKKKRSHAELMGGSYLLQYQKRNKQQTSSLWRTPEGITEQKRISALAAIPTLRDRHLLQNYFMRQNSPEIPTQQKKRVEPQPDEETSCCSQRDKGEWSNNIPLDSSLWRYLTQQAATRIARLWDEEK